MSPFTFIHILAGFSGLASGIVVMAMPNKGNKIHKRIGLFYFSSMMISTLFSIWLCYTKNNVPLLAVAIFTFYMLMSGFFLTPRRFKIFKKVFIPLSLVGIVSAIYMIYTGVIFLVVFGGLQFLLVLQDLRLVTRKSPQITDIIGSHIGKMAGSFITACTAFSVNVIFTGTEWWHWLLPTFAITPLITFWNIRLKRKRVVKPS